MDEPTDGPADRAYLWIMRAAYLALITANLWFYVRQAEDTVEGRVMKAKATRLWGKVVDPIRRQREWAKDLLRMHVDAEVTVEQAAKNDE